MFTARAIPLIVVVAVVAVLVLAACGRSAAPNPPTPDHPTKNMVSEADANHATGVGSDSGAQSTANDPSDGGQTKATAGETEATSDPDDLVDSADDTSEGEEPTDSTTADQQATSGTTPNTNSAPSPPAGDPGSPESSADPPPGYAITITAVSGYGSDTKVNFSASITNGNAPATYTVRLQCGGVGPISSYAADHIAGVVDCSELSGAVTIHATLYDGATEQARADEPYTLPHPAEFTITVEEALGVVSGFYIAEKGYVAPEFATGQLPSQAFGSIDTHIFNWRGVTGELGCAALFPIFNQLLLCVRWDGTAPNPAGLKLEVLAEDGTLLAADFRRAWTYAEQDAPKTYDRYEFTIENPDNPIPGTTVSPAGDIAEAVYTMFTDGERLTIRLAGALSGTSATTAPQFTELSTAVGVNAGTGHNCGLTAYGDALCWGNDRYGQSSPPSGTFVSLAATDYNTCGIKTDGTLECWGAQGMALAKPPSGRFTELDGGRLHVCAVRADDTGIQCWGSKVHDRHVAPQGEFVTLSAGGYGSCGLRMDGTVECWGAYLGGATPAGEYTAVARGTGLACAIRSSDRGIDCWGSNSILEDPPTDEYTAVAAGNLHACGLKTDGTIGCWGSNNRGQKNSPTGTFSAINAALHHTCAANAGGLVCWGGANPDFLWRAPGSRLALTVSGTGLTPQVDLELIPGPLTGDQITLSCGTTGATFGVTMATVSTRTNCAGYAGGAVEIHARWLDENGILLAASPTATYTVPPVDGLADHTELTTLANTIPQFGGLYLGDEASPTVHVNIKGGTANLSESQLADFESSTLAAIKATYDVPQDVTIQFEGAEYSIAELAQWYAAVRHAVWGMDAITGTVSTDLNEDDGYIDIGVLDTTTARLDLDTLLAENTIPTGAVRLEQEAYPELNSTPGGILPAMKRSPADSDCTVDSASGTITSRTQLHTCTLRSSFDQLIGGIQIGVDKLNPVTGRTYRSGCTLGFTVEIYASNLPPSIRQGQGFVTNDHCTGGQEDLNPSLPAHDIFQPLTGTVVGEEAISPYREKEVDGTGADLLDECALREIFYDTLRYEVQISKNGTSTFQIFHALSHTVHSVTAGASTIICDYYDAAYIDSDILIARGLIAKPDTINRKLFNLPSSKNGSITGLIVPYVPFGITTPQPALYDTSSRLHNEYLLDVNGSFKITDVRAPRSLIIGTTVSKVGARTGMTTGSIKRVCRDIRTTTNIYYPCIASADYFSAGGDSGSPVFKTSVLSDEVDLVGLNFAASLGDCWDEKGTLFGLDTGTAYVCTRGGLINGGASHFVPIDQVNRSLFAYSGIQAGDNDWNAIYGPTGKFSPADIENLGNNLIDSVVLFEDAEDDYELKAKISFKDGFDRDKHRLRFICYAGDTVVGSGLNVSALDGSGIMDGLIYSPFSPFVHVLEKTLNGSKYVDFPLGDCVEYFGVQKESFKVGFVLYYHNQYAKNIKPIVGLAITEEIPIVSLTAVIGDWEDVLFDGVNNHLPLVVRLLPRNSDNQWIRVTCGTLSRTVTLVSESNQHTTYAICHDSYRGLTKDVQVELLATDSHTTLGEGDLLTFTVPKLEVTKTGNGTQPTLSFTVMPSPVAGQKLEISCGTNSPTAVSVGTSIQLGFNADCSGLSDPQTITVDWIASDWTTVLDRVTLTHTVNIQTTCTPTSGTHFDEGESTTITCDRDVIFATTSTDLESTDYSFNYSTGLLAFNTDLVLEQQESITISVTPDPDTGLYLGGSITLYVDDLTSVDVTATIAPSVTEGDSLDLALSTGGVTPESGSGRSIVVRVQTVDSTTTAGSDYTPINDRTVDLSSGSGSLTLQTTEDGIDEPREYLTISFTAESNVNTVPANITVSIADDDYSLSITVSDNASSAYRPIVAPDSGPNKAFGSGYRLRVYCVRNISSTVETYTYHTDGGWSDGDVVANCDGYGGDVEIYAEWLPESSFGDSVWATSSKVSHTITPPQIACTTNGTHFDEGESTTINCDGNVAFGTTSTDIEPTDYSFNDSTGVLKFNTDLVLEKQESITISFTPQNTGLHLGGSITLYVDDLTSVDVTATIAPSVTEGDSLGLALSTGGVTPEPGSGISIKVSVKTVDGTAIADDTATARDYTSIDRTVDLSSGSGSLTLQTTEDGIDEPREYLTILFTAESNVNSVPTDITVSIADDDYSLSIMVSVNASSAYWPIVAPDSGPNKAFGPGYRLRVYCVRNISSTVETYTYRTDGGWSDGDVVANCDDYVGDVGIYAEWLPDSYFGNSVWATSSTVSHTITPTQITCTPNDGTSFPEGSNITISCTGDVTFATTSTDLESADYSFNASTASTGALVFSTDLVLEKTESIKINFAPQNTSLYLGGSITLYVDDLTSVDVTATIAPSVTEGDSLDLVLSTGGVTPESGSGISIKVSVQTKDGTAIADDTVTARDYTSINNLMVDLSSGSASLALQTTEDDIDEPREKLTISFTAELNVSSVPAAKTVSITDDDYSLSIMVSDNASNAYRPIVAPSPGYKEFGIGQKLKIYCNNQETGYTREQDGGNTAWNSSTDADCTGYGGSVVTIYAEWLSASSIVLATSDTVSHTITPPPIACTSTNGTSFNEGESTRINCGGNVALTLAETDIDSADYSFNTSTRVLKFKKDLILEKTEFITISFTPANAGLYRGGSITLSVDDSTPLPSITVTSPPNVPITPSVIEGEILVFMLSTDGVTAESGRSIVVSVQTVDSTTTASSDYTPINNLMVDLSNGSGSVTLRTIENSTDEPSEYLTISFTAESNVSGVPPAKTVRIADDDYSLRITVSDNASNAYRPHVAPDSGPNKAFGDGYRLRVYCGQNNISTVETYTYHTDGGWSDTAVVAHCDDYVGDVEIYAEWLPESNFGDSVWATSNTVSHTITPPPPPPIQITCTPTNGTHFNEGSNITISCDQDVTLTIDPTETDIESADYSFNYSTGVLVFNSDSVLEKTESIKISFTPDPDTGLYLGGSITLSVIDGTSAPSVKARITPSASVIEGGSFVLELFTGGVTAEWDSGKSIKVRVQTGNSVKTPRATAGSNYDYTSINQVYDLSSDSKRLTLETNDDTTDEPFREYLTISFTAVSNVSGVPPAKTVYIEDNDYSLEITVSDNASNATRPHVIPNPGYGSFGLGQKLKIVCKDMEVTYNRESDGPNLVWNKPTDANCSGYGGLVVEIYAIWFFGSSELARSNRVNYHINE